MLEAWSKSVAAGMDDAVFWGCTPSEATLLLGDMAERDQAVARRADLRAGLIAATIVNTTPRKSRRVFQPTDFFPDAPEEVTLEQMRTLLSSWAASHNRVIKA